MGTKSKPKRSFMKSQSHNRQALFLCMLEKQNGRISNLPVVGGEPQLSQAKVKDSKRLDKQCVAKPASKNFCLKEEHLRLIETLDELGDGVISFIKFRDGLPVEVE